MKITCFIPEWHIRDWGTKVDEKGDISVEQVYKLNQKIKTKLSVFADINSVHKPNENKISIIPTQNNRYDITGKILAGHMTPYSDIHLLIDVGVPIELTIKNPREYKEKKEGKHLIKKILIKKKNPDKFVFRKGGFIFIENTIISKYIEQDEMIHIDYDYFNAIITKVETLDNWDTWLNLECLKTSVKNVKFKFTPWKGLKESTELIDKNFDEFILEY